MEEEFREQNKDKKNKVEKVTEVYENIRKTVSTYWVQQEYKASSLFKRNLNVLSHWEQ